MQTFTFGTTPENVILQALGGQQYPMVLKGEDALALVEAVNQGIDSHLQAVTRSTFKQNGQAIECSVVPEDLLVILRRLGESDDESAWGLRSCILFTLGIDEV